MSNDTQGSRLKPDAPEFVPLKSKVDLEQSPSKLTPREAAKAQKKLEKEEKKAASLSKRLGKKARFEPPGMYMLLDGAIVGF